MPLFFRRRLEAWFIRRASSVLMNRNVARCQVVSRRDNNEMWAMAERLEAIADRIKKGYP